MSTVTTSPSSVALHDVSTVGRGDEDRMMRRRRPSLAQLTRIELRKMFDTRSGFWLLVSIGVSAALATLAVLIFASDESMTYENFSTAIGLPMSILLPVIGILAITSEWTQRSGLSTFTLVPTRGRVVGAKLAGTVLVGVVSMLVAMGVGAVGNLVGSSLRGVDTVWSMDLPGVGKVILANVLGMLMGFMFGTVIRNSAGALVTYFAYAFVLPTISGILISTQAWYRDIYEWVDFPNNVFALYDGAMGAAEWGYLGFTAIFWLVIPLAIGIRLAMRSEVK